MFQSEMHEFHNADDTHNWRIIEREKRKERLLIQAKSPEDKLGKDRYENIAIHVVDVNIELTYKI